MPQQYVQLLKAGDQFRPYPDRVPSSVVTVDHLEFVPGGYHQKVIVHTAHGAKFHYYAGELVTLA